MRYTNIRYKYEATKEIAHGVKIHIEGHVDMEIAESLRGLVRSAYDGDDAGCDYLYDEKEGVVCIAGQAGWWDSREPLHVQLLKTADMLDGGDFTFDYKASRAWHDGHAV